MDRKKLAASRLATLVTIIISIWIELAGIGVVTSANAAQAKAGPGAVLVDLSVPAVCIKSDDPDLLTPRKIYEVLPDASAEKSNYIRVIDNEGEDYLYLLRASLLSVFPTKLRNSFSTFHRPLKTELLNRRQIRRSGFKLLTGDSCPEGLASDFR